MCTSVAPRLAQQTHDARAGGAAHDGIVHQHHALALHRGRHGVQFDAHEVLALGLRGLYERAGDVLALDKADAVGDAALPRVAQRRVEAAVRHADDHVGLHGVLQRQERAGAHARHVDARTVDHGIRAGKVDVLEHAGSLFRLAYVRAVGAHAVLVHHHDLARLQIAHQMRADGVQSTTLRGEDGAAPQLPDAQGPETVRVARGDQLGGAT